MLVVDGYGLWCWWQIDFGLGFTVMEGRWVNGFWLMVGMVCGGGGQWWVDFGLGFTMVASGWVSGFWFMVVDGG